MDPTSPPFKDPDISKIAELIKTIVKNKPVTPVIVVKVVVKPKSA